MKPVRALVSVSDKRGLVPFARRLATHGIELVSTGGTARVLREAGLEVVNVSDVTGFPEMMDGRVKTLHPKVHGGILARRGVDDAALAAHGIGVIDLVVVNLYPFEATIARDGVTLHEAVEQIDIGGPCMVRAAAKNHRWVSVVVDPSDYDTVLKSFATAGAVTPELRHQLAAKAFVHTARYDSAIATYLADATNEEPMPTVWGRPMTRVDALRYGENPHQSAGLYVDGAPRGLTSAEQLQGKALSYNNWIDADAAFRLASDLGPRGVAIFKHTNPCGAALSAGALVDAYRKARECDPVSYFGGIVGTRGVVDEDLASELVETFLEVIVCGGVTPAAASVLAKKKRLRVLHVPEDAWAVAQEATLEPRPISGGMLVQQADGVVQDVRACNVVTARQPTPAEWEAMAFGWKVVKHVKSNAIVFAHQDRTVGIGAGQMSRVDSARIAVAKSGGWGAPDVGALSLDGSIVASDAFFPFADGVLAAADAGASAVIQPGGSVRDSEVIEAADSRNLAMVFTGHRHFRH